VPTLSTVMSPLGRINEKPDSIVKPRSAKAEVAGFQNIEDTLGPPAAMPANDIPWK
jgi:hypothetical protein